MTRRLLTLLAAAALAIGHPRVSHSARAQQPPQTEPARPSSFTLIDRALEAKTIDAETAHKYRVFAAYGDTRLPTALRGDDKGMRALPPYCGSGRKVGRLHHSGSNGVWPGVIPSYTLTCPSATNPAERTATMTVVASSEWFVTDLDRDELAGRRQIVPRQLHDHAVPRPHRVASVLVPLRP